MAAESVLEVVPPIWQLAHSWTQRGLPFKTMKLGADKYNYICRVSFLTMINFIFLYIVYFSGKISIYIRSDTKNTTRMFFLNSN